VNRERKKELKELEKKIGVRFKNKKLLDQALTHRSFAYERKEAEQRQARPVGLASMPVALGDWQQATAIIEENERMEFLGDALLNLVISGYLYEKYPHYDEGDLTKLKAVVVSRPTLVRYANLLNLGNYLLLGKGEELSGGRKRNSILSDVLEAVIGALYLDRGYKKAQDFVLNKFEKEIEIVDKQEHKNDYKSRFQEIVQKKYRVKPLYRVLKVKGPHHNKDFEVEVRVRKETFGQGRGKSKKEAEQAAAREAIKKLPSYSSIRPSHRTIL
jgi:ribonuclease-3